jgi:hypothetical protein
MREALRYVPLIGLYVEIEGAIVSRKGVVVAVQDEGYTPGWVRITFADRGFVIVEDPAELLISVYRRAPDGE